MVAAPPLKRSDQLKSSTLLLPEAGVNEISALVRRMDPFPEVEHSVLCTTLSESFETMVGMTVLA